MAEGKQSKVKISAAEHLAMERNIRDQERLQKIRYDDSLVKMENQVLKYELKTIKADRIRAQLMEKLTKSKSLSNKTMTQSVTQSMASFQMESVMSPTNSQNIRTFPQGLMQSSQFESLPIIKRKGTSHHRRFVNEVRPRDYGLYLDSLSTLKDYRHAEHENRLIKEKLFQEKYRQQMGEYRMLSQAAWTKVTELNQKPIPKVSAELNPGEKKIEKTQNPKPADKNPTGTTPADKKAAETKLPDTKTADPKPADKKQAETKPADNNLAAKVDQKKGES